MSHLWKGLQNGYTATNTPQHTGYGLSISGNVLGCKYFAPCPKSFVHIDTNDLDYVPGSIDQALTPPWNLSWRLLPLGKSVHSIWRCIAGQVQTCLFNKKWNAFKVVFKPQPPLNDHLKLGTPYPWHALSLSLWATIAEWMVNLMGEPGLCYVRKQCCTYVFISFKRGLTFNSDFCIFKLDIGNSLHLFCCQYVFVPRLQNLLNIFRNG